MSPRVRDLLSFISVDSNATFLSIDLLKSSQTINLKCRLSFVTWHWKGMSHTDRSEAFPPVIVSREDQCHHVWSSVTVIASGPNPLKFSISLPFVCPVGTISFCATFNALGSSLEDGSPQFDEDVFHLSRCQSEVFAWLHTDNQSVIKARTLRNSSSFH